MRPIPCRDSTTTRPRPQLAANSPKRIDVQVLQDATGATILYHCGCHLSRPSITSITTGTILPRAFSLPFSDSHAPNCRCSHPETGAMAHQGRGRFFLKDSMSELGTTMGFSFLTPPAASLPVMMKGGSVLVAQWKSHKPPQNDAHAPSWRSQSSFTRSRTKRNDDGLPFSYGRCVGHTHWAKELSVLCRGLATGDG